MSKIQTAECVSSGHPDKVADYISDSVLDFIKSKNPEARAGIETMVTTNTVIIAGETSEVVSDEDLKQIVKKALETIGYTREQVPSFCSELVRVENYLNFQSSEIAQAVVVGGAGDQGIMFGYSTSETRSKLPLCQEIAANLMRLHDIFRKRRREFLPDAKSQVTIEYDLLNQPSIKNITLALSHKPDVTKSELDAYAYYLVRNALSNYSAKFISTFSEIKLTVNGTGSFTQCGPETDVGLTGRKIVIDQTFAAPVGGGAFSGKDLTKVDRLGAYFCRLVANSLVNIGACDEVTVGVSFTIGKTKPDSISVQMVNNHTQFTEQEVANILSATLSFAPKDMLYLGHFDKMIFKEVTNYGHYFNVEANPSEFSNSKIQSVLENVLM